MMRSPEMLISRAILGGKIVLHMSKMGFDLAWKDGMGSLIHTQIIIWLVLILNLGVGLRRLTLQVEFGIEAHLAHLLMVDPQVLPVDFLWTHFLIIVLRFLLQV